MTAKDIFGLNTKRMDELGLREQAEALTKIILDASGSSEIVWDLEEACRLTISDHEKETPAYKTVSLLGGEACTLVGAYVGKANGIIFQFKPANEATYAILGVSNGAKVFFELSATQKIPLRAGLVEDGRDVYVTFREWAFGRFEGQDPHAVVEKAKQEREEAERAKLLAIAKEKEETYGTNWGEW